MVSKQITPSPLMPHGSSLVQVLACRLFGANTFPEPMLAYCQLDSGEYILVKFEFEFYFSMELEFYQNGGHFVQGR